MSRGRIRQAPPLARPRSLAAVAPSPPSPSALLRLVPDAGKFAAAKPLPRRIRLPPPGIGSRRPPPSLPSSAPSPCRRPASPASRRELQRRCSLLRCSFFRNEQNSSGTNARPRALTAHAWTRRPLIASSAWAGGLQAQRAPPAWASPAAAAPRPNPSQIRTRSASPSAWALAQG